MTKDLRFLAVGDVAEVLNVSVRQVRALLATGELRGIQVGGRGIWRVEDVALEQYIDQQYQRNDERLRADDSSLGGDERDSAEDQNPQAP